MKIRPLITAVVFALLPIAPVDARGSSEEPRHSARAPERAAPNAEVGCNFYVTRSITLTEDIGPCPDYGLKIEDVRNITVNLNEHTIRGMQGAVWGIEVFNSSNITIMGPGTVRLFKDNVLVEQSTKVKVVGLTVLDAGDEGIQFIDTQKSVAKRNTVDGAWDSGMSIYSDYGDGVSKGNTFVDNDVRNARNILIDVGPQLGSAHIGSRVVDNRVLRNRLSRSEGRLASEGIQLRRTSGNRVEENVIDNLQGSGIHLVEGSTKNTITLNQVEDSQVGVNADAAGNAILRNKVSGSSSFDLREGAAQCVNTWRNNSGAKRNLECID